MESQDPFTLFDTWFAEAQASELNDPNGMALATADATLTRAGWQVRTRVAAGAPLRELLATVDSADAELLVVGARGVSGLRRLLLGSVAEGALNRCPVPVLVVR